MFKTLVLSLSLITLLGYTSLSASELEDDLSRFAEDSSGDLDGFTQADDDLSGFGEDKGDLSGFSDDESLDEIEESSSEEASNFNLSGNVAFKTSVGYKRHEVDGIEYSGFNQAQISTYLQLDTRLNDNWKLRISGDAFYDAIYKLRTGDDFREEILDDYQTQLRLDDTYVQGSITDDLDLKAGRQIVVWGKSDTIRITDIINPLDNRLPGLTDIEDLRLSVGMAKFDYYLGQWNISAMIIAENRIMMEAPPRSEYFPVDTIFNVPTGLPDPFPELQTPSTSWDNMQYALAANGVFEGWDLSFYAADVLDQKWHFRENPSVTAPLLSDRIVTKIKMLGSAVNISEGSWLFKAEAAYLDGVKYNNTSDDKSRLDALIGCDYMGIRDTTFSVELANRHIFDYETQMQDQADFVDEDEMQTAIRVTRSFENDTINVTALLSMFGSSWENGGLSRVWAEYELMDALSANIGIVEYIGGDKPFMEGIKNNDKVFADIQYSF